MRLRPLLTGLVLAATAFPALAQPGRDNATDVYKQVIKSTVWVHSERGRRGLATGSGSLIDKSARLVLTNFHVVGDNRNVTVFFPSFKDDKAIAEKRYYTERERTLGIPGRVIELDRSVDLAIIQLERVPASAPELKLANGSADPGQSIHSVGNPGGSGALWVYTAGKVRQVYQKTWKADLEGKVVQFRAKVVETDSPTNPGDSGGPLVNDRIELVGVTQGGATNAQLISTFVDLSEVKKLMARPEIARLRKRADERTATKPAETQPARSGPPKSDDAGKLFGEAAWKEFVAASERLNTEKNTDFAIDTVATPPGSSSDKVKAMSPRERLNFFKDVADERVKKGQVDGIYVLICRSPGFAFVEVTPGAVAAFPDGFRKKIEDTLLKSFGEKKFDEGLREVVKLVSDARGLGEKK
jgi:S1-C subfamily serine protease